MFFQSPVPIFKKSADIHAPVKDKTTPVAPLQDNYEEVEMDIDSDPGSPGNYQGAGMGLNLNSDP